MIYLKKQFVKDLMCSEYTMLNCKWTLRKAIEVILKKKYKEIFVIDDIGNLKGGVTLFDILSMVNNNVNDKIFLDEIMNNKLITISKNKKLVDCRSTMIENKINVLPVVEKNKLIGLIKIADINDYLYKKEKENRTILLKVINNISQAVCVINNKGKVVIWNKKAEEIYNIKSKEITNKYLKEFFSNAIDLQVLSTKKSVKDVYHVPEAKYPVIVSAFPIYMNNEFLGVVSTDVDVEKVEVLSKKLKEANDKLKFLENQIKKISDYEFGGIIGRSKKILDKIQVVKQVANTKATILLTGESGTGKEVFARAIHDYSEEKGHFVPINCSAIPEMLFESEFFGYEKGAFTGANKEGKIGLFELANRGTIFLDEIGDLPLFMQAKLLRVLQEQKVKRVGANNYIDINPRIVSATNKDLEKMVRNDKFREDLYYRLNVIKIELPPLRERGNDIFFFIKYFLKELSIKNSKEIPQIDEEVMEILSNYKWPGNIRELKNIIEYLIVISKDGRIKKNMLPNNLIENYNEEETSKDIMTLDLNESLIRHEKFIIKKALEKADGNKSKAAKLLKIPRTTLYYKLNMLEK